MPRLVRLDESSLCIVFGETIDDAVESRVRAFAAAVQRLAPQCEIVPAFASVAVLGGATPELVEEALGTARDENNREAREVEIPVCYAAKFAPDLDDVARHTGLDRVEIIARHSAGIYRVNALGFAPGFPYLSGLDPALAMPRRATPRTRIEAGAVGIGGAQTGVYPLASPGGWNLIGRTPLRLFRPEDAERPTLVQTGDRVRFRSITEEEHARLAAGQVPAAAATVEPGRVVRVLRAGQFTTLQSLAPRRLRQLGLSGGGAMDRRSAAIADLLARGGGGALLECTLSGPELWFESGATVALCGAEAAVSLDGRPLPMWRPVYVPGGSVLAIGAVREGVSAYLGVAGGFAADFALGGSGTDVRAGIGGFQGRPLRAGDCLTLRHPGDCFHPPDGWSVSHSLRPPAGKIRFFRVLAGEHAGDYPVSLASGAFRVSPQSDRMGIRLGGTQLRPRVTRSLLSSAVLPGTIQVPPDGEPILLGVDAQTIGGYPKIAQVIRADLWGIGQLRPGDEVRFAPVSLDEARQALADGVRDLSLLACALSERRLLT